MENCIKNPPNGNNRRGYFIEKVGGLHYTIWEASEEGECLTAFDNGLHHATVSPEKCDRLKRGLYSTFSLFRQLLNSLESRQLSSFRVYFVCGVKHDGQSLSIHPRDRHETVCNKTAFLRVLVNEKLLSTVLMICLAV